ncbi:hypothetical protein KEM52_002028 [Ascosphaera acerosa]|nr:hypothetical protein KEM52_002028 [Ascosphaera acerosa]
MAHPLPGYIRTTGLALLCLSKRGKNKQAGLLSSCITRIELPHTPGHHRVSTARSASTTMATKQATKRIVVAGGSGFLLPPPSR